MNNSIYAIFLLLVMISCFPQFVQAAVVVELFESQGCSSCPPAERVLSTLTREFGLHIIPLTFHVDYWDYLGWKDVYSSPIWTQRQKEYAKEMGQSSIYTPEMIVQGSSGFVGSDERRARREVTSRLASPESPFQMDFSAVSAVDRSSRLTILVPKALASQAREIIAVITEDAPPVRVLRGENSGEMMSGESVVRAITRFPNLEDGHSTIQLSKNPEWNSVKLRVAVLVRGDTLTILAAQQTAWAIVKQ